jgi:hypothetical protein
MSKQTLTLDKVRIDGGTQARASINAECVAEYAERIKAGDTFPDPVAFFDGAEHWLAEGFHRYHALRRLERKKADFDIRKGTLRDAILFAAAANSSHGLRRTSADKRKAVKMLLADPEWAGKSNRWIAEACCVSDMLVADVRDSTASSCSSSGQDAHDSAKSTAAPKREGKDGKSRTVEPAKPKEEKTSDETGKAQAVATKPTPAAEPDPPAETPEAKLAELQRPYREAVNAINEIRRTFSKLIEDPKTGAHLGPPWNRIKKALDDAKTPLAQAAPAAWCPKCGGKGCAKCQQTGWLPKSVWDGLPEAEKK